MLSIVWIAGCFGQARKVVDCFQHVFFLFFPPTSHSYYTATLAIGTPPLSFDVIVDTGSTMTYVPCAGCGRSCGPHHQAGFSVDASSTAHAVRCATPACACGSTPCGCGTEGACTFAREYAEQSTASGVVVSDVLWLPPSKAGGGGAANTSSSPSTTPRITLGCTTKETGEIQAQRAAGVAGLGNATTGLVAQLAAAGATDTAAFALCLAPDPAPGASNHHGVLVLGGGAVQGAPAGVVTGPVVRTTLVASRGHPAYYALPVSSMALVASSEDGGGGSPSSTTTDLGTGPLWSEGAGVVLDSGSTFSFLPRSAAAALRSAVTAAAEDAGCDLVTSPASDYGDPCWQVVEGEGGAAAVDDAVSAALPAWRLAFSDGPSLTLPPTHYMVPHVTRPGAACLGVYASPEGRGSILGAAWMRGLLVEVDASAGTVALTRADCRALGDAAAREAGQPAPRPQAGTSGSVVPTSAPAASVVVGVAVVVVAAAAAAAATTTLVRRRRRRQRGERVKTGSSADLCHVGQRGSDEVELGARG